MSRLYNPYNVVHATYYVTSEVRIIAYARLLV